MNKDSLWDKDFITIFTINFFVAILFNLLIVTIASYAIELFNTSESVAGFTASIFVIGALIGRLVAGPIIGTEGKKVLIVGLFINLVTIVLYLIITNLPLLLINRLIHGFAFGAATTAAATMIAQILPDSRRGEGIGYYSLNITLGQAIGPFLGILLSHYANFTIIFVCAALLAAISLALSFSVIQPVQKTVYPIEENTAKKFQLSNFIEFTAIPIAIVSLVVGIGYSVIGPFLSVYATQIDLVKAASFFFPVYAISILFSRPFSGRLLDTKGANFVIYPSLIIFAAGMLLYSHANHGIILLLAAVLVGLGYGNFHSCAQAMAIKGTPPYRFGSAMATYFLFYETGYGMGPYLFGSLIPCIGWRNLYLIVTIVILADIVFYYFLCGRKEKQSNLGTTM